ncbi:MAG: aldose 1-epimerase family protein [Isosphaeraceae bacterium]
MRHLRVALLVAAALVLPRTGLSKEPYRRVLVSASRSMNVDPMLLARDVIVSRYVTPECPSPWSVRKYRYFGGKQEGVDVIWIDNGILEIALIPTRGMGVQTVLHKGTRILGWDSPVKEIVHPKFINLQSRGGLGWLEGFSEWLCRCGMEWNGQAGPDQFVTNTGAQAEMDLTLHGRIANLPAQEVELIAQRDPPFQITIRGIVHERMMHGPKLELTTEFTTVPMGKSFRINDAVTNRGGQRQEFQMLYHANFGPPLLEEGSTLLAPVEVVTPFNDHAAGAVQQYAQFSGPREGAVEQVYTLRPLADRAGRTRVLLRNRAGDLGTSLSYDTRELPCLTLWKNLGAAQDGYVTGIEPGTNYPNNRRIERKHGRVPTLSPGESHYMAIDFSLHIGTDEVKQAAQEVAKIQGDRRPLINEKPEKHD